MSRHRGIERWIPRVRLLFLVLYLAAPRGARADVPASKAGAPEPLAEEGTTDSDYMVGEQGHRFRVRFDPASRISLGIAGALLPVSAGAPRAAAEASLGFSYRGIYRFGKAREQVLWQVDTRVLPGYVRPFGAVLRGAPAIDAAVYNGSLLRHDESPSIVLPISPPASIPFPFDVGFETEIGRVYIPSEPPLARVDNAKIPALELGVMRASFILDPWRSGKLGRSFEIGVGARYDFGAYFDPTQKAPRIVHRVAPMTASSLRFRFQSQDGLALLDVRADLIPHWTSEGIWRFAAQSSIHLSRTLLAVNDQPIDVVLDGGYHLTPATESTLPIHDVRVSLGLSFNLALK